MLFIINADGTVQTTFPSQVYQGSNAASDIIVVAPWVSGAAITVSFELPNGARTTPSLVTPQDTPVTLDGVEYKAWRALLPYAITQYAGTVTAQFSIYTGTQTVTSSAATFDVYAGAVPLPPSETGADVYQQILAALGAVDTKYVSVEGRVASLENGLAGETDARESADAALGQRVNSVESGLTSEAAARQAADTALGNRIDAVEGDIDGKVDKVQAGTNYKVYGVKPANGGGAQTSIDATEFSTNGNTIVMRDPNGGFYVKDPVYETQPVNLRTQNAAIDAAKAEAKAYTDQKISQYDIVSVVSELPATGDPNRIYLLTKTGGTQGDLFDEYVWENGAWERVGSASVDLSQYATVEQLDGKVSKVGGAAGTYVVYAVDSENNQTSLHATISWAEPNSVAMRTGGGALVVADSTNNAHAVNNATMKKYVAENAISLTTTGTIEPASGSRVMTLGSNGNVILIEGNPSSYMLVGVKSNGDPVMYKPNNYSAESQTVAVRGTGGVLAVGTPTAANHATTKQYVDEKCVNVNCDFSALSWTKVGQVGPDAINDIAWTTPYSALGIKSGAKAVIWVLTNAGYPYKTGSCVFGTYPTTEESGGLIQFTNDGNLTVIGAGNPANHVAPHAVFVVFY